MANSQAVAGYTFSNKNAILTFMHLWLYKNTSTNISSKHNPRQITRSIIYEFMSMKFERQNFGNLLTSLMFSPGKRYIKFICHMIMINRVSIWEFIKCLLTFLVVHGIGKIVLALNSSALPLHKHGWHHFQRL